MALSTLAGGTEPVRVGHFTTILHSQALIGKSSGQFERELGVPVQWRVFNAGPSAVEALMAGHLDLLYVGPNPAINGYVRTDSEALRIIAGAASGGASLIVHPAAGIRSVRDFDGKKVGTPQLGNTQDVAARSWLRTNGYQFRERGGTVMVLPISSFEQLILFRKEQLQASWLPEPWATRLVQEAGGMRFLDERDLWPGKKFTSAMVVARREFLAMHPGLVKKFLQVHVELTEWISTHPGEAKTIVNKTIAREMGKPLSRELLDESWKRFDVTYDPAAASLLKMADNAYEVGFLGRTKPDLAGIFELNPLNEVLSGRKLGPVSTKGP